MHRRKLLGPLLILGSATAATTFAMVGDVSLASDKPPRSTRDRPLSVSMLQLIARPGDFDGEYVRVHGFYRREFEGTSIYLHREDYEQALSKNGLWVTRDEPEHDLKYVLIEGRFNAKRQGHMGLWSGEIDEVTRMIAWPPRGVRPAR